MDRSAKNGFRCALYPEAGNVPPSAFAEVKLPEVRDFTKEKPVPDSVFGLYRELYSYDKTNLKARVESRQERPDWIYEKVSFEAAYGGKRVMAHLFLPKNAPPPYQTVVYFPGAASFWLRSSQDLENYYEFTVFLSFLVKNGRAVLYPVYKNTFERISKCARREGAEGLGNSLKSSNLISDAVMPEKSSKFVYSPTLSSDTEEESSCGG